MLICAFDPGRVTGWALYSTKSAFASGENSDPVSQLDEFVSSDDVVVIERYEMTEQSGQFSQQTDALEVTGAIRARASEIGMKVVMQNRSAKNFDKSGKKIRALGWHKPTKDNHADDAAKHLLRYAVKNGLLHADDVDRLRSVLRG